MYFDYMTEIVNVINKEELNERDLITFEKNCW